MSDSLEMLGNYGCYVDTGSTISFQLGTNPTAGLKDPGFVNSNTVLLQTTVGNQLEGSTYVHVERIT